VTDHLRELYRGFSQRLARTPDMGVEAMRDLFDQWQQATAEPAGVHYVEAAGAPVPATWCLPPDAAPGRVLVHAHGGGFVVGSRHSHRKLGGHLAARGRSPVLVVDYRRAPEHPFPAAVDDLVATVDWLRAGDPHVRDVVLSGDSAGGNLAVTTALRLAARRAAPGAVIALSPWFDLTNSGASVVENAPHDAMVDGPTLEIMAGLYLAAEAADAAAVNPLFADLRGLPPVYLAASSHETLRDDAVRFAARARAVGVPVVLDLVDHQQHVFQMGAGRLPAADASLDRIGDWLVATPDTLARSAP
jgi:acetyl esterase/lipase